MIDQPVLRVIAKFIIPFILLFGCYVQLHGDYSPGGGFQAGLILASAFILYALTFDTGQALAVLPVPLIRILLSVGVGLYGLTGVISILHSGNFLDYSVLSADSVKGQHRGIFLVELGVGLTVFSSMLLLFLTFANYGEEHDGEDS